MRILSYLKYSLTKMTEKPYYDLDFSVKEEELMIHEKTREIR